MNSNIDNIINDFRKVCEAAEAALVEWGGVGSIQFPVLHTMVISKLGMDMIQDKDLEAQIRQYVRKNPKYHISRGAKGGVMLAEVYQAKMTKKVNLRREVEEAVNAKLQNNESAA